MAEENLFSDEVEKCFTQRFMEGFGLELPTDSLHGWMLLSYFCRKKQS
jgi:hypothetical protein